MVLESPRAGALFRICDPKVAAALAMLATPHTVSKLRRQDGFPGDRASGFAAGLPDPFQGRAADSEGLRATEGDAKLVLWDFHDLLFHTHSTEGRQANPLGGLYPYAGVMPPPPAVRPAGPARRSICASTAPTDAPSPFTALMQARHSTRGFDDGQPITLAELSQFLDATRAHPVEMAKHQLEGGGPVIAYTTRPYPAGGSSYELELYLTVTNCEGLDRGFYHYDADRHALVPIKVAAA